MFEVEVLDKSRNKRFTKVFNSSISAWKFVNKIKYSKKLVLLGITDNSYMFD